MNGDDASAAFSRALRLLTRRDHSEQELRRKLEQKGHQRDSIAGAMDRLKKLEYLDDRRFAASWVEGALTTQRFFGARLGMELQRRGISGEMATEVIGSAMAEREETELLDRLLARKFPRFIPGTSTAAERRRVFDYLRRRGFSASNILQAMRVTEEG